jgi:hypothetical protein
MSPGFTRVNCRHNLFHKTKVLFFESEGSIYLCFLMLRRFGSSFIKLGNMARNDDISVFSGSSLPSALVNIPRTDRLQGEFSSSVPLFYGRSADIWGAELMPCLRRHRSIFEETEEEVIARKQASFHEEEQKNNEAKERRKSEAKKRKGSLVDMGLAYKSGRDLLKPEKKVPNLKPAKKMSKHSTTIRKLKPEGKKVQEKKQHTKIPGPLPRVLQRAKIQRMLNQASANILDMLPSHVETTMAAETPSAVAFPVPSPKSMRKLPSLRDAGKDVISAIRYESQNSKTIMSWEKYFGDQAKSDFYRQYHVATKYVYTFLNL